MSLCLGTTLQGRPCRRYPEPNHNGYCAFHDPAGSFVAEKTRKREQHAARKIAAGLERERRLTAIVETINARYRTRATSEERTVV